MPYFFTVKNELELHGNLTIPLRTNMIHEYATLFDFLYKNKVGLSAKFSFRTSASTNFPRLKLISKVANHIYDHFDPYSLRGFSDAFPFEFFTELVEIFNVRHRLAKLFKMQKMKINIDKDRIKRNSDIAVVIRLDAVTLRTISFKTFNPSSAEDFRK